VKPLKVDPAQACRLLDSADEIHSADSVASAVKRVAAGISAALDRANPLVLCVMRGGALFSGYLLTELRFPLEFDYADVTRYDDETRGGALNWRYLPEDKVAGRDVLLLDDILDEGITLAAIRDRLAAAGARRVWIAVLAEKVSVRVRPVSADFVGLPVPDRYVFGFGMDVHGYWRNLPAIYALKED
jgi:hypoxanthine phosphoribosyltransferase